MQYTKPISSKAINRYFQGLLLLFTYFIENPSTKLKRMEYKWKEEINIYGNKQLRIPMNYYGFQLIIFNFIIKLNQVFYYWNKQLI
jgi:uncharacterized membrane protein